MRDVFMYIKCSLVEFEKSNELIDMLNWLHDAT